MQERAAPAAGAKRKGHLRFPFLFELLPFPWIVWRRLPTCDRSEIGERERIFSTVFFVTCSQCQMHYCYTDRKVFAGAAQGELPEGQERVPWGMTVPHNSLARYDRQGLRRINGIKREIRRCLLV